MEDLPEIILIDKPKGVSSFGALGLLRRRFDIPKNIKIGHAGTLDPMATGLLLVGVGKGTKKLKHHVGLNKMYEAEILLGMATDTGDAEGRVTASEKLKVESLKSRFLLEKIEDPRFPEGKSGEEKIKEVVEGMAGKWILPVPIYSATKQGGEALYKKARRGAKIIIPNREMEIRQLEVLSIKLRDEKIFIQTILEVSSGTYIRSIAEEVGRRLGVPATLSALRRTKIGEFDIKDAIELVNS